MKRSLLILLAALAGVIGAQTAQAICPICTVAVGAGIGLSRWFGVDDAVTGLWLGGFLLSVSLWTIDWLNKKNIRFVFKRFLVILAYYVITIVPLYYAKIITNPLAFVCSCASDKLLLGTIEGTAVFFFGTTLYDYLKEKNGGRAHFPYEKVAFPVGALAIATIIFYFLTK